MKFEEIDKIIRVYLDSPEYVFSNYRDLVKVISEEEKDLTPEKLETSLKNCSFKAPDVVALQCMLFPPLHFDILDRVLSSFISGCYKVLVWFILFSVILLLVGFIKEGKPDFEDLAIILSNSLCISFVFRLYTKRYNTLELIYQVLHIQGKI